MALTKRQREILDFIEGFIRFRGYSPSFEEIAEEFGYRSLATVHEHLENLQAKGYVRKNYNESRSVELVEGKLRVAAVELPLYGNVAAGQPIEVIEEQETVSVPEDMISGSLSEHYVLRVRGDSMIDEQIRDGDYVIVQSRETAHNAEMVIALVHDEEDLPGAREDSASARESGAHANLPAPIAGHGAGRRDRSHSALLTPERSNLTAFDGGPLSTPREFPSRRPPTSHKNRRGGGSRLRNRRAGQQAFFQRLSMFIFQGLEKTLAGIGVVPLQRPNRWTAPQRRRRPPGCPRRPRPRRRRRR